METPVNNSPVVHRSGSDSLPTPLYHLPSGALSKMTSGYPEIDLSTMQATLDPSLLKLTKVEEGFLHSTISKDDYVLRSRIIDIQKR